MHLLEVLVNQHRMDQAVSRGETHLISVWYVRCKFLTFWSRLPF